MIFGALALPGVYLITPERHEDERGFFARTYCEREFAEQGLPTQWVQASVSYNHRRGTLRGMHFQTPPHEEDKLIRCTRGAIFDVLVDIRPDSPAYLRHVAVDLTAENRLALLAPKGVAHGFLTLEDDTEVFYQMSTPFAPGAGRGYRYDDPAFGISWPMPPAVINERDRTYPDYAG